MKVYITCYHQAQDEHSPLTMSQDRDKREPGHRKGHTGRTPTPDPTAHFLR